MLLLAFSSPLSSCDSWLETCLLSVDACAALPASCGSCATCVAAKPAAKPAAAKPAPTPAPTPAAEVAARHPAERKDKKSVASRVQHWWATGRPATNISDAGTLVRVFDALTPPKGQPKGVLPWEPCRPHTWCEKFNAAWPSSIVSKYRPVLYRGPDGPGGFVLAPTNRIFCASPGDGNSMGHMGPSHGCQRPCDPSGQRAFDCSFPPEGLETCLRVQGPTKYNEIVVDAERLHAKLPHSLLAVFFTNPSTEGAARWTRDVFLQTYKEVKDFPLLRLTAEGFEEVT